MAPSLSQQADGVNGFCIAGRYISELIRAYDVAASTVSAGHRQRHGQRRSCSCRLREGSRSERDMLFAWPPRGRLRMHILLFRRRFLHARLVAKILTAGTY